MLLRVWRISTAASAVPSTNAGMIMRRRLPDGLSQNDTKPEAGSQPSRTEKNRISMIPSQKLGTETPQSDAPLASRSQAVLRRTAASTPRSEERRGGEEERARRTRARHKARKESR